MVSIQVRGDAGDMEPETRPGSNPDPFNLRVKPELLIVLQHAGLDLLASDGAPCSEAVGLFDRAHSLTCGTDCPRVTVRDCSSLGLMAR